MTILGYFRDPVREIIINDDGENYKYAPQKDITCYELALLLRMFLHNATNTVDYYSFIKENKLERHFCKIT